MHAVVWLCVCGTVAPCIFARIVAVLTFSRATPLPMSAFAASVALKRDVVNAALNAACMSARAAAAVMARRDQIDSSALTRRYICIVYVIKLGGRIVSAFLSSSEALGFMGARCSGRVAGAASCH